MTDSKDDSMSNLLLTHLENPHKVNDIPEKAEPVMGDNTSAKPTLKKNLTETTEREDMGPIKLPSLQNKTEQRNDPPAIPVVQNLKDQHLHHLKQKFLNHLKKIILYLIHLLSNQDLKNLKNLQCLNQKFIKRK